MSRSARFINRTGRVGSITQIGHADTVIQEAAGESYPSPMMAPSTPINYSLRGRDDVIEEIRAILRGNRLRAISLELTPGIGKTALACLLANDEELQALFPDGVLWAHLGKEPDLRNELRQWALELGCHDQPGPAASNADYDSQAYWQRTVSRALRNLSCLLVVDDVWTLDNGRAFEVGGNRCAYLFTTRFPGLARQLAGKVVRLKALGMEDGLAVLEQFAPEAVAADPQAARDLVERVDGLPQALVLIGSFLRDRTSTGQARHIRQALRELESQETLFEQKVPPEYAGKVPRSLRSVIETSYEWLGGGKGHEEGEALRRAVTDLAILRPNPAVFSEALAASVADTTPAMLDALCYAGLIEARGEGYAMHRTLAEYLRGRLSEADRSALHRRAAAFHRERLRDLEEVYQRCEGSYGEWFRYEDRAWGDAQDDWLYHLSRAGDVAAVVTVFLRAWFDGFWWWGCFLEFHFCDQLLREWRQRDIRPESREGLQLIQRFKDAYPKETEDRRSGNWAEVEVVLRELRARLGLDGDIAPGQGDAVHLRGLTSIFLAEARRFGARDAAGAEAFYRDALAQFERDDDDWDRGWVGYHLADFLREQQRWDAALALCEASLPFAEAERDPELQANLWRVEGDVAMACKDFDRAAERYAEAIGHAYRFQVEPEAPDPYTIRFYVLVSEAVTRRLSALWTLDSSAALAMARQLACAWGAEDRDAMALQDVLRHGDARVIAAALFPASLPAEQLAAHGAEYAAQVKAILAVRRAQCAPLISTDAKPSSG